MGIEYLIVNLDKEEFLDFSMVGVWHEARSRDFGTDS